MFGFLRRLAPIDWMLLGAGVLGCLLIVALGQYPSLLPSAAGRPAVSMLPPGAYAPKVLHDTLEQRNAMIRAREQDLARHPPEKVPPLPEQRITPRVMSRPGPASK